MYKMLLNEFGLKTNNDPISFCEITGELGFGIPREIREAPCVPTEVFEKKLNEKYCEYLVEFSFEDRKQYGQDIYYSIYGFFDSEEDALYFKFSEL